MKTIKAIICEPGKKAYVKEISTDLKALQGIVGGLIEFFYLSDHVFLVCNDEGKIINLPMNRVIRDEQGSIIEVINGTFFIAKDNEDEDSDGFESLTTEEVEFYLKKYLYPDDIFLVGNQIMAFPYYEAE